MSKLTLKILLLSVLASLSLTSAAQSGDQGNAIATLRVEKGVVMTSTGGDFVTANTGDSLIKDERLMVSKDGLATVVYKDNCQRIFNDPGVYKIDGDCKAVVWWGSSARATAAIVAGAVAVGVLVNNINNNNNNNPPISR